jgi:hypothetical protein
MSLVVPNTANILMLQYIVNIIGQDGGTAPSGGDRMLRLFTNNLTPGKSTVLGDVVEAEPSTGYTSHLMPGGDWTTTSSGGVNMASYNEHTFSFTNGITVYGYYVTTIEGTPKLLWIERFTTAPYVLPSGGGEISITPRFTLN